jgi:hypothetical protein
LAVPDPHDRNGDKGNADPIGELTIAFVAKRSPAPGRIGSYFVAEAKARRDHRPKMKGVVGLIDRWRMLLSRRGSRRETVVLGYRCRF